MAKQSRIQKGKVTALENQEELEKKIVRQVKRERIKNLKALDEALRGPN